MVASVSDADAGPVADTDDARVTDGCCHQYEDDQSDYLEYVE
jgi:hypothetical protein